jgi:hypothetical protein
MNDIEIVGGTKAKRDYARSMVEFCIKKLMPRMQTLDIVVKLKKLGSDADGYCLRETAREYELEIDHTTGLRRMLETVAHEMVHVKQYARNEMSDTVTQKKFYKWKDTLVPESTDYWDLPWEIEANGREVGLFIRWAQANGHAKKAWANIK